MKRKIKNFNDFMRCIKAFKKVTSDFGYWTYFLSDDGYICKICDNLSVFNIPINGRDLEDMEVEEQEQEPFKIEVGKFYRTRDGRKAHCFFADKCLRFFRFTIDGLMDVVETNKDGEQIIPGRFDGEMLSTDIVGYWDEFEDFKWWTAE